MKLINLLSVVLVCCSWMTSAFAGDYDGSQPLICATVEARDCVLRDTCFSGNPGELGAPAFIRIDFKKKLLKGEEITSPILNMASQENQLILQGTELDFGWTFSLEQASGKFAASLTNAEGAFLLYGSCTPE
ncbi:MAG: hypothetical protein OQJ84_07580 [Xanthomonadales bacterium]|nr:hypothetical protein [Xanthomonadales bacterium]